MGERNNYTGLTSLNKTKKFLHLRKRKRKRKEILSYIIIHMNQERKKKGVKNVRACVCRSGSGGPQSERESHFFPTKGANGFYDSERPKSSLSTPPSSQEAYEVMEPRAQQTTTGPPVTFHAARSRQSCVAKTAKRETRTLLCIVKLIAGWIFSTPWRPGMPAQCAGGSEPAGMNSGARRNAWNRCKRRTIK